MNHLINNLLWITLFAVFYVSRINANVNWDVDGRTLKKELLKLKEAQLHKICAAKSGKSCSTLKKGQLVDKLVLINEKRLLKNYQLMTAGNQALPHPLAVQSAQARWTPQERTARIITKTTANLAGHRYDASTSYIFIVMKTNIDEMRLTKEYLTTDVNKRLIYPTHGVKYGHTTLMNDQELFNFQYRQMGFNAGGNVGRVHWGGNLITDKKGYFKTMDAGSGHLLPDDGDCIHVLTHFKLDKQEPAVKCEEYDDAYTQPFNNLLLKTFNSDHDQNSQAAFGDFGDNQYDFGDSKYLDDYSGRYYSYPEGNHYYTQWTTFVLGTICGLLLMAFICCFCMVLSYLAGVLTTKASKYCKVNQQITEDENCSV